MFAFHDENVVVVVKTTEGVFKHKTLQVISEITEKMIFEFGKDYPELNGRDLETSVFSAEEGCKIGLFVMEKYAFALEKAIQDCDKELFKRWGFKNG